MASRSISWAAAALLIFTSCSRQPSRDGVEAQAQPPPVATTGSGDPRGPVHIVFNNVRFHAEAGAVLEVRWLKGTLVSTRPGQPPVFDDQRSFALEIDAGVVAISPASLTRLLNANVFAFEGSPLTDVEVTIEGGHLKQKATLHKGVPVPVSMEAEVAATPDGRVRLHPLHMSAAGVPSRGLLKTFGLELDDLVDSYRTRGFEVVDNDLLLSADRLVTAPAVRGKLTAIRIEGDRIVQVFGNAGRADLPSALSKNFMQYRGGVLRFGKLTMTDTDMQLLDADPRDTFDFDPARYVRQLVAGYSKNTPDGGLRVYMPDYDETSGADLTP
jgi:hypothetical protein